MNPTYSGTAEINRAVDDLDTPIWEVVKLVEMYCKREFHASTYYREHPELLFPGHPWIRFINSGDAPLMYGFPEDWPVTS